MATDLLYCEQYFLNLSGPSIWLSSVDSRLRRNDSWQRNLIYAGVICEVRGAGLADGKTIVTVTADLQLSSHSRTMALAGQWTSRSSLLHQPKRGLGLVWRDQPTLRDRLGWALAPEVGYETAGQRTSYPRYNHIYVRAVDENVWQLLPERSSWHKVYTE